MGKPPIAARVTATVTVQQHFKHLAVGVAVVGLVAGTALTAAAQPQSHGSSGTAASSAASAARNNEPKLPELETDRPDITESSSVVGAGLWQLETGILFQSDRVEPITLHDVSAPNGLLRLGINSRLELRIGGEGFLSESLSTPGTEMSSGVSDLELGFKYKIVDQDRAGVDFSVIPIVSVPVGSDAFSSGSVDPTIKFTLARDLPRGFGLGGNLIVASITEDHSRFTQTALSASLGHGLGAHWGGFWELYWASALSRGGDRALLFDTGVTHALGEHMQLDLSIGRGLTHDAPDWFIGAGFAIRGFFKH
jgi:Putative MetA-pathway of phenol degradation